ncbi:MAG: radical SAM protein, partial [Geobacter sp.]
MTSRILTLSVNRELAPQPVMPIGAAWVAEALHQARFEVNLLDLCFEKKPLRRLAGVVQAFKPNGVAVSIRNIDNCDFIAPRTFLPQIKEIIDCLKSSTNAPILIGGSGVSIMPLQILDYLDLEYAVAGEGEEAVVRFFQADDAATAGGIPGLVCRGGTVEPAGNCELSPDLVVPHIHRWIDTSRYLRLEPVMPVQGKRGCANRCLYCTYNRIEGEKWRLREPAAVVEEILAAMADTQAREFEFVDSVFNQPAGYLEALLEEIIRRQVKAKLHVSSVTPKGLTKEQVELMEKAGVASVVITPEAASDVTLAALRKDFTAEDVTKAAELFARSTIKALWCFLVGGPKEDPRTLDETISFINNRIGKKDTEFITTGIRIYPKTGLHEVAIREGIVQRGDSLLMPSF